MSEVRRFEDLDCWKKGRELSNMVYSLSRKAEFKKDYGLTDQIRRAAVSAMTNIAEGFERGSNKDFVKFLFIAKASAGEVRSLLYVALDQQFIDEQEFNQCSDVAKSCSRLTWGMIKSLRSKSDWVTGLKILLVGLATQAGLKGL